MLRKKLVEVVQTMWVFAERVTYMAILFTF